MGADTVRAGALKAAADEEEKRGRVASCSIQMAEVGAAGSFEGGWGDILSTAIWC